MVQENQKGSESVAAAGDFCRIQRCRIQGVSAFVFPFRAVCPLLSFLLERCVRFCLFFWSGVSAFVFLLERCVRFCLSFGAVCPVWSFFGSGVSAVYLGWQDSGVMSKLFRIKGLHRYLVFFAHHLPSHDQL